MPAPTGPVTLGDLIREDKLLWVYCCDCYALKAADGNVALIG